MTRPNLIRVVVAVVVLVAATGVGMAVTQSRESQDRTLIGMFANASPLVPGSEVRAAGVDVGKVQDITLQNRVARVRLTIDPKVLPVHRDARLRLRPVNLLGEQYVELDPGSPNQPFLDKQVIPVQQTSTQVSLQDVLNTFDNRTSTALAALVTTLGEGSRATGPQLAAAVQALAPAMDNTNKLGGILGQQNTAMTQLLDRVKPVAQAVAAGNGGTLDQLVSSTKDTLSDVAGNREALDQTLTRLPQTVATARQTLANLSGTAQAATPTLQAVRPVTNNLSDITGELNRLADAADPALASLQPVLQRADALLKQAAPVVAGLKQAGPQLRTTAKGLHPLGDQLLDQHLDDLMQFVRKWALSTNDRDGLSHYFRGVVHITPNTLKDLTAYIPVLSKGLAQQPPGNGAAQQGKLLPLPGLQLPKLPLLQPANSDSATGLTEGQEQSMLGQLLGD
jgi:phospholipid/cholesterol/gamma-HCH transport system substrate-binding protein